MPVDATTTFDAARTAYYANRDYDVGAGDAREFRRACELLLELMPQRSNNRDGEIELNLQHLRDALKKVNEYIDDNLKVSPTERRVKYLRPDRG